MEFHIETDQRAIVTVIANGAKAVGKVLFGKSAAS